MVIPNLFAFTIVSRPETDESGANITIYFLDITDNESLYYFTFLLHSVILKLVPCIALPLITACLIRALY